MSLTIRRIAEGDSIAELTELLHKSYRILADMGMKFFATHQTEEETRDRVARGRCFVGECDGRIVGTITLYANRDGYGPELYRRDGVGYFGQFAIDPAYQGRGYGNLLLDHVENEARTSGMSELGLDTAETATHLIDYYSRHGYEFVEHVQWHDTNYRSVVLRKSLNEG